MTTTERRGFFGVAIYHPKREVNVGSLLRTAHTYGAAYLATVGRRYEKQSSDTTRVAACVPLVHHATLDDLVEHLPESCPLVGVEQSVTAMSLTRFAHPPRALYLLGAEDHGLPPEVLARCHRVVEVPTPSLWPLNVAVAGSLVIHDRYVKAIAGMLREELPWKTV